MALQNYKIFQNSTLKIQNYTYLCTDFLDYLDEKSSIDHDDNHPDNRHGEGSG